MQNNAFTACTKSNNFKCIDQMSISNYSHTYILSYFRGFRKWWQSLPDKKRHYFVQSARKRRQEVAIFIGILCVCWYIYYWTHLQEAPVTKRERFIAFTDYQFDKIMEFNAEKVCFNIKISIPL